MIRIAVLQSSASVYDPETGVRKIKEALTRAAQGGSHLLILPELFLVGYGSGKSLRKYALNQNCSIFGRIVQMVEETGVGVIFGFSEKENNKLYNSAMAVLPGRESPLIYRKCQLYGDYEWKFFTQEVPETVTFTFNGLKVGILICYDVEFPEHVRRLALAKVDIVVVPTALPQYESARFIADCLIPTRAYENHITIAYANYCGKDNQFTYSGFSTIAGPDGQILAQADFSKEMMLLTDISPDSYVTTREESPYLEDLHPFYKK